MLLVVNHLINQFACDEDAKAARAQSLFFAHARVLQMLRQIGSPIVDELK